MVEGEKNKAIAVAYKMLAEGMDAQIIAKFTGLTDEEVQYLKKKDRESS